MIGIAGLPPRKAPPARRNWRTARFCAAAKFWKPFPASSSPSTPAAAKANQYFLRGFNLDHGTDFATFLDDMPLNLPSHAHGEGYSDMNTVIPEFVERVDYEKGPYYADVGNFGSAGAAHLEFYKTLPQDFVTVEGGMYGYERGVFGIVAKTRLGQFALRRRSVSRRRPVGASG
jgi:hypothetical protein